MLALSITRPYMDVMEMVISAPAVVEVVDDKGTVFGQVYLSKGNTLTWTPYTSSGYGREKYLMGNPCPQNNVVNYLRRDNDGEEMLVPCTMFDEEPPPCNDGLFFAGNTSGGGSLYEGTLYGIPVRAEVPPELEDLGVFKAEPGSKPGILVLHPAF